MYDAKGIISEGKKTAMETKLNQNLKNYRETHKNKSFLNFPMNKFILKMPRSTTNNLVKNMLYFSKSTF